MKLIFLDRYVYVFKVEETVHLSAARYGHPRSIYGKGTSIRYSFSNSFLTSPKKSKNLFVRTTLIFTFKCYTLLSTMLNTFEYGLLRSFIG